MAAQQCVSVCLTGCVTVCQCAMDVQYVCVFAFILCDAFCCQLVRDKNMLASITSQCI